jgi:hypothetical protein
MLRPPSLRTRFLLIVLVGAVLPLGLIGFWLTRTSLRSGEELLSARLDEALESTATSMEPPAVRPSISGRPSSRPAPLGSRG